MGLFINAHSPTLTEQLAHSGYDWLLVDTQHGPMDHERHSVMLGAIGSGTAPSPWCASKASTTGEASSRRWTSAPSA